MLGTCLQNVREKGPLVHNITNYVTVNDVANVILACGASPIMSDEPQDVQDITAICGGLNINIGTLNVVTSAKLGTTTGAKVGFFGTTPIGRKAVSRATGSTVASCNTAINNLITALKAYGLIS